MMSLVIPIYRNAANIPPLLAALAQLNRNLAGDIEIVFVVDRSPDDSYLRLAQTLPISGFRSQLLLLSRNFGAFSAIRAGLAAARGTRFAVMAADLQEPPQLIESFDAQLRQGEYDVVVGQRISRGDPPMTRFFASLFWGFYRRYVQQEIPEGGVDVFGCNKQVRDQILLLRENNSSLIGLLFWVGFRRSVIAYERRVREIGKSAWTFEKKMRYLMDSVFSFSDLPIRLLLRIGGLGLIGSIGFAAIVLIWKLFGAIPVPGYAATVLLVSFFGALNCFGLGVIGGYVWRTFENTKYRPNFIVARHDVYDAGAPQGGDFLAITQMMPNDPATS